MNKGKQVCTFSSSGLGPGHVCLALGPHCREDTGPLTDSLPVCAREQPSQHPEPGHGRPSTAASTPGS